ncbi:MAG: hypothetical protein AAFP69_23975, partial [Planctomycetota bacterium]
QLMNEVACQDPMQLLSIEQDWARKKSLLEERATLRRTLAASADDMSSLDEFIQSAAEGDSSELESDVQRLSSDVDALSLQRDQALKQQREAELALETMSGGDQAAVLDEQIQSVQARIANMSRQYAQYVAMDVLLQQTVKRYQQENEAPVLAYARSLFQKLTCGLYEDILVESDGDATRRLAALRHFVADQPGSEKFKSSSDAVSTTRQVDAQDMSEGTADALYLALRLGALMVRMDEEAEPIPLVLDDILVMFDDQRSIAALKVLADLSTRNQILYYSHHQHIVDLCTQHLPAERFQVHRLDRF